MKWRLSGWRSVRAFMHVRLAVLANSANAQLAKVLRPKVARALAVLPFFFVIAIAAHAASANGSVTLNAPPNDLGLVGYWSFDSGDVSGTTVLDQSGSGNNGTTVNSPKQVPGKLGQALSFNGTSQYVSLPNNTGYDANSIGTITAWIRPTENVHEYIATVSSPSLGTENLVDFSLVPGTVAPSLGFQGYYSAISENNDVTSENSVPLNKWSFVVVELKTPLIFTPPRKSRRRRAGRRAYRRISGPVAAAEAPAWSA